jgi:LPS sulfotransferase NodH
MAISKIHLRHQVTPFVILFIERDGSTHMVSMLSTHPDILVDYERLDVMKQQGKSAADQLVWANNHLSPALINRYKALGFKTKLKDVIDLDAFTQLLYQKKAHIIHMQRQNVIKAVISRVNARRLHDKTGVWNLYDEADRLPAAVIDPEQFDLMVQNREAQDRALFDYVGQLQLPQIRIAYEDLLQDQDGTLRQVFDFLHVKWFPVEGKTKKNTSDDLREVVENYDELRTRYIGTRYESMFDEVLVADR